MFSPRVRSAAALGARERAMFDLFFLLEEERERRLLDKQPVSSLTNDEQEIRYRYVHNVLN